MLFCKCHGIGGEHLHLNDTCFPLGCRNSIENSRSLAWESELAEGPLIATVGSGHIYKPTTNFSLNEVEAGRLSARELSFQA